MTAVQPVIDSSKEKEAKVPVKKNDIRPLRFRKQLLRVNLDLDSPRMKEAMFISGVKPEDLEFK